MTEFHLSDWSLSWIALIATLLATIAILIFGVRRRRRGLKAEQPLAVPQPSRTVRVAMMSFKDILIEYERRRAAFDGAADRIDKRLSDLRGQQFEGMSEERLLRTASPQELAGLTSILTLPSNPSAEEIVESVLHAGSNTVASLVRIAARKGPFVVYRKVASDVARKLGAAKPKPAATVAEIERSAIESAFNRLLEEATPEQRAALLDQLRKEQQSLARGAAATASGLVLAHMSGFGLYVVASSVLGAVTSTLGVTLPFAAYTGMSTVIATVIGPIGWATLAVGTVAMLGRANYKKTVPAVIAIATIRIRLIAQRDQDIAAVVAEQEGDLAKQSTNVAALRALLDHMTANNIHFMRKEEVPL